MPQLLKEPTESDRNFTYKALWIGLPASWLYLAGLIWPNAFLFQPLATGFTIGSMIALFITRMQDEFAQQQIAFAALIALSVSGALMGMAHLPWTKAALPPTDVALAIIAVSFHTALAGRRLRDALS
ncbi:MAG: hypothetical protein AAF291_04165 [Pseudomonadota bacterium]